MKSIEENIINVMHVTCKNCEMKSEIKASDLIKAAGDNLSDSPIYSWKCPHCHHANTVPILLVASVFCRKK